jgi:hypothetical protein
VDRQLMAESVNSMSFPIAAIGKNRLLLLHYHFGRY